MMQGLSHGPFRSLPIFLPSRATATAVALGHRTCRQYPARRTIRLGVREMYLRNSSRRSSSTVRMPCHRAVLRQGTVPLILQLRTRGSSVSLTACVSVLSCRALRRCQKMARCRIIARSRCKHAINTPTQIIWQVLARSRSRSSCRLACMRHTRRSRADIAGAVPLHAANRRRCALLGSKAVNLKPHHCGLHQKHPRQAASGARLSNTAV